MKLFKEIKLKNLFIYTFLIFSLFFAVIIVFSMIYEVKNRQIFDTQTEFFKINKNLNSIKNNQNDLFLHKRNQYVIESEELFKLNSEINRLDGLIDSIITLKIIKKNNFTSSLAEFKSDLEKYQSQCDNILKINEQLYSPNVGVVSQLEIISTKLKKENKYQELDLIKYLSDIELYRKQLIEGRITKREFEKKATLLFEKIASTQTSDYEKYYVLLFEDNITNYYNNTQLEYSKRKEVGDSYNEGLLLFLDKQYNLLLDRITIIENQVIEIRGDYFRRSFIQYIVVILLIIVLNVVLFNFLYRILYKPWFNLQPVFEDLSIGKIPEIDILTTLSEFKIITTSLDKFVDNIKSKNSFILELSKRNYTADFVSKTDDELGVSLSKLQSELIKAEKESVQYQETEQNQKWTATGIAKIGAVMRQNTEDIDGLSKNVLKEIIQYVDAVQGALYLYNEKLKQLELNSSFSYGKQRTKNHTIQPYEGLLGTIIVEKRDYYYKEIPENYLFLETGLGYSKPKSLFAFPLLFENKIYGVIELASMSEFKEYERNFLKNLGVEIAITISYTEINVQTKTLLEQSKKQAIELQSNEKLFKKNQDNLKSLLRMTEQRLRDREETLKIKEQIVMQKVQELLELQKELSEKEEYIENVTNEYENIKSELENKNTELRERIAELDKRLRDKN
ncbi:MAG: GAF domain-containing protein [Bacteroidales bacterium]|nr:GAF domain-containing protein [Bacteroidales bacterium]